MTDSLLNTTDALRQRGGWVLAAIVATAFVGWLLCLYQYRRLHHYRRHGGTDWNARVARVNGSSEARLLQRAIESCRQRWLRSVSMRLWQMPHWVGTAAATLPLLGLLGTLLGMIETFHDLSLQQDATRAWMGRGIGRALLTTQAGLALAVPLWLSHAWLSSRTRACLLELDRRTTEPLSPISRPDPGAGSG